MCLKKNNPWWRYCEKKNKKEKIGQIKIGEKENPEWKK